MAAQLPHPALVDWTIDPPHAALQCSLTQFTHWLRASIQSGASDLTPGPDAVAHTSDAAVHDPEAGLALDDTLGEIADTLLLALDAAGVALYERTAEGPPTPLAVRGTHSAPWFSALAERYPGSLLDGTLTEGYRHITLSPTPMDPEPLVVGALRRAGFASLLLVPLLHRDQSLGLLATIWRTAHPVSEREVQLARVVAGRAARTLAGQRLAARLRAELQRSDLPRQVVKSINAAHVSTHLLPTILASAASLVGARVGLVTRWHDDAGIVRIAAVHHLSSDLVGFAMPFGLGVSERALSPGEAAVHDAEHPLPRGHPLRALYDTPVWLTVALGCGGGSLGTIALAADPAHRFGPSDAQIARLFAGLATLAIEKAQLLARAQEAAVLEERQRIARDLHDSVTQTLFGLQTVAQAALDAWEAQPEQARTAVETVQHLARAASVEMRTLLVELRDTALQGEDLAGALEQHVAVVRHQSGLAVDLEVAPDLRLPARHAEVLYRIVQEALSNVVKHARARWARIMVAPREAGVEVRVEDDGVGLPPGGPAFDAFGLRGMRERVSALGGTVQMGNGGTGGAYVHAELPLLSAQHPITLVTDALGM